MTPSHCSYSVSVVASGERSDDTHVEEESVVAVEQLAICRRVTERASIVGQRLSPFCLVRQVLVTAVDVRWLVRVRHRAG